ncbi:MAG: recombinase family protein [Arcobacteraceae bacterium]
MIIEEKEAKLVKDVFSLRLENKSYSTIAKILKDKYSKKIDFDFNANRIHKLAINKFYYGVFTWA